MNDKINKFLDYYINTEEPKYAVLLTGDWGCGKTFFIEKKIEEWENKSIIKETNNSKAISFRPIYVTLNGVKSIKIIKERIRTELNPILYSKGAKVAKGILKGLLKTAIRFNIDLDEDENSDGNITFSPDLIDVFRKENGSIKGEKILVFDDIERSKIDIDELFGFLNNFIEHAGCKVILIADESKIKEKYKDDFISYDKFKEKLVGKTFELKSEIEKVSLFFINNIFKDDEDINSSKQNIIELLSLTGTKNLRVIRQSFLELKRLKSEFESCKTHKNFSKFIYAFKIYFIITYIELREGNKSIHNFQSFNIFSEDNYPEDSLEKKYNSFLQKYGVPSSNLIFPIGKIVELIENGYLQKEEFNQILHSNEYFRVDKTKDWEKLYEWEILDNKEFYIIREKLFKKYIREEIDDINILLHLSGIFLELIDQGLINKDKNYIKNKTLKILTKKISISSVSIRNRRFAYGRTFKSYDSKEFRTILKEIEQYKEIKNNKKIETYIKDILYNENIIKNYDLDSNLDKYTPNRNKNYKYLPYFKYLNGHNYGSFISSNSNHVITYFTYYLDDRYVKEVYDKSALEEESQFFRDFKESILKQIKKRDTPKNLSLKKLDKKIDKIIKLIMAQKNEK